MWYHPVVTSFSYDVNQLWRQPAATSTGCDARRWRPSVTSTDYDSDRLWRQLACYVGWLWRQQTVTSNGCDVGWLWRQPAATSAGCDVNQLWRQPAVTSVGCNVTNCGVGWLWRRLAMTSTGCDVGCLWRRLAVTSAGCDVNQLWRQPAARFVGHLSKHESPSGATLKADHGRRRLEQWSLDGYCHQRRWGPLIIRGSRLFRASHSLTRISRFLAGTSWEILDLRWLCSHRTWSIRAPATC